MQKKYLLAVFQLYVGKTFLVLHDTKTYLTIIRDESSGYDKKMVTLHSYTGRELEGFIFMNKSPPVLNLVPSSRYLGV